MCRKTFWHRATDIVGVQGEGPEARLLVGPPHQCASEEVVRQAELGQRRPGSRLAPFCGYRMLYSHRLCMGLARLRSISSGNLIKREAAFGVRTLN